MYKLIKCSVNLFDHQPTRDFFTAQVELPNFKRERTSSNGPGPNRLMVSVHSKQQTVGAGGILFPIGNKIKT